MAPGSQMFRDPRRHRFWLNAGIGYFAAATQGAFLISTFVNPPDGPHSDVVVLRAILAPLTIITILGALRIGRAGSVCVDNLGVTVLGLVRNAHLTWHEIDHFSAEILTVPGKIVRTTTLVAYMHNGRRRVANGTIAPAAESGTWVHEAAAAVNSHLQNQGAGA